MFYSLVNLEGKTLDTFRDQAAAHAALRAVVHGNPSICDEVLLLQNEDDGQVAAPSLMYEDVSPAKVTFTTSDVEVLVQHRPAAALGYFVGGTPPQRGPAPAVVAPRRVVA